jgi:hypothetical protein
MIHLKKNDKIIVIVGVVILLIAGIGIAVYSPAEQMEIPHYNPDGMYTYDVSWNNYSKTVSIDTETYAGRGSAFNHEIDIEHKNILNVIVEISWEDDYSYGIIFTKGLDTLTADIQCKGKTDSWVSVGNGSKEFYYSVNAMPYDTQVQADTTEEALEKVYGDFYKQDTVPLIVDVTVDPGERIWRPLKYIRDKGNTFDLTVRYEYYEVSLSEGEIDTKGNNNNNDNDDDFNETDLYDENYQYLGKIIIAGLTRW